MKFNIEAFQLGCWETIDLADDVEAAVEMASVDCMTQTSMNPTDARKWDDRIRIIGPDCKEVKCLPDKLNESIALLSVGA